MVEEKVPSNKRIEETFRLLRLDKANYKDAEHVAQAADNIGRTDVSKWIRGAPWKFHLWVSMYADAYDVPSVADDWE